jgi:type VI secretion system protein ImpM
MSDAAGYYGKLPALGDFVQRRLPQDFVTAWDTWLQQGMLGSQDALGSAWLETYLTAHVWHFVLMPGQLGKSGWAGVWTPSVDRIGRYFPLTLAAPLPSSLPLGASAASLGAWLKGLEEIARAALAPESSLASVDAELQALGPLPSDAQKNGAELLPCVPDGRSHESTVELHALTDNGLDSLATAALSRTLAGCSVWWCYDRTGQGGGFIHRGLPEAAFLGKMLTFTPRAACDA